MASDKKILEQAVGPIIGLVCAFIAFKTNGSFLPDKMESFYSKISDISFIVFGFLLTVLALILQIKINGRRNLKLRMIRFNKRIVFISLFLGILSLINSVYFTHIQKHANLNRCLCSIFIFLLAWLIVDAIYYLIVFYKYAHASSSEE